jgi:hypothetical protein
MLFK